MPQRFFQILLIGSTLVLSWLGMMAVHELGHVLHAWWTGGTVTGVVLHPLALSRTDVGPNPHPLVVAWGGVVWGCLLPLAVLGGCRWFAPRYAYLAAWFAGFCLIANGAYLAGGVLLLSKGADDAGQLLMHGAARWQLIAFGLLAVAAGLRLWNGLGPHFGLGAAHGAVDRRAALGMALALLLVVAVELLMNG
jgi:hypothetical protein